MDTTRTVPFTLEADEPAVLLGTDKGANPVEYVLHALVSCMTTSMVYHAAARGIEIESVSTSLEGDLDLQGFLGLSDDVRKGYSTIRVNMDVASKGSEQDLRECISFSPVYEMISPLTSGRAEYACTLIQIARRRLGRGKADTQHKPRGWTLLLGVATLDPTYKLSL